MTAVIEWTLSPADVPVVATLRYAPLLFFGGYLGLAAAAGLLALPALLANPGVLALVALLVLVGGPLSLAYLWPMIRDPDQRPAPQQLGWIVSLDPLRAGATAVLGAVTVLAGAATAGATAVYALLVLGVVVPLPVVALFDGEGSADLDAGTLTFQERTVDVGTLAAVRPYRWGPVTVCRLSYVEGSGGIGRPYVVAFPEEVAEDVRALLDRGVAADADATSREPDPLARAVLVGTALVFFAVAAGASLAVEGSSRTVVALVAGGIGLAFAVAAYTVA